MKDADSQTLCLQACYKGSCCVGQDAASAFFMCRKILHTFLNYVKM